MSNPQVSNQSLRRGLVVAGSLTVVAMLLGALLRANYSDVFAPGAPWMQGLAAFGSLLLVMAFLAAFGKRHGSDARVGFRRHVWLALIGTVLVALHSTGEWLKAPFLILVTLILLAALGGWARTAGARAMAQTFGSKRQAFRADAQSKAMMAELIESKGVLLQRLNPGADEALFSLRPEHWLRSPLLALRYQRLVWTEARTIGRFDLHDRGQTWWRLLHQCLAWGFLLGLLVHVVLVLFFAGYVADGNTPYWWHITAWNF